MKIDAGGEMMFQKREENGVKGGDEWRSVEAGRKKAGAKGKRNSRKKEEKSNEKKMKKMAKEMALLIFITIRK